MRKPVAAVGVSLAALAGIAYLAVTSDTKYVKLYGGMPPAPIR